MEIVYEKIDKYIPFFSSIIGEDFVHSALEVPESEVNKCELEDLHYNVHPLWKYWNELKKSFVLSKKNGHFIFNENSIYALNLFGDLSKILHLNNNSRIIDGIKNNDKFYSSIFELRILIYYLNYGLDLEILEENQEEKSSDLKLKFYDGDIFVECKSLKDLNQKFDRKMKLFMRLLLSDQYKQKKSSMINIRTGNDNISLEQIHQIRNIIRKSSYGEINLEKISDGSTRIETRKISEWDEWQSDFDIKISNSDITLHSAEIHPQIGKFRNLRIVNHVKDFSINNIDRILENLKKARKQIPKGNPGIIHIEFPSGSKDEFFINSEKYASTLSDRLHNDSSKTIFLILTNIHTDWPRVKYPEIFNYYITNKSFNLKAPEKYKQFICNQKNYNQNK